MNFKSTLLAAAATLIVAAPAMAQDATTQSAPAPQPAPGAAAPAAPAAPAPTPAQAAFQAEAEAFQQRVQPMESEIVAAVTAAGTDAAKAQADADAVIDRYAVEFTTFADKLDAFLDSEIAASTDQAAIAGMTQAKATAVPQLRRPCPGRRPSSWPILVVLDQTLGLERFTHAFRQSVRKAVVFVIPFLVKEGGIRDVAFRVGEAVSECTHQAGELGPTVPKSLL